MRTFGVGILAFLFALSFRGAAADDAAILPHPFTAEQIRDEWVEGLTLVMRRETPAGVTRERWTVVAADERAATIEYTPLDERGQPAGAAETRVSSWDELRDHASFAAETTRRSEVRRETALGTFDGWLYVVSGPIEGTLSEYFFARDLPGAPLEVKVTKAGQTTMEMKQILRSKP